MQDRPSNGSRFVVLDGMRGVAALMVMVMHTALIFPMASLAVDLFFGLSGFVLAHGYGDRLGSWRERRDFVVARLIRLEPLWLIGCAMSVPAGIGMAYFGWADWGWTMLSVSILTAPFFIILPYFGTAIPLNPPGWSLTFELIANAVLVFVGARTRPALVLIALAGPPLAGAIWWWDGGDTTGMFALWACLPRVIFSFFLGVLLQRCWAKGWLPKPSLPALPILVAVALLCGLPPADKRLYLLLGVFLFCPMLLWFGAGAVARGRLARFCAWMGDISYGVYVLHVPLVFTTEGLRFLWAGAKVDGYVQTGAMGWAVFPLTILLAHLLTRHVDRPARAWLTRRWLDGGAPKPTPASQPGLLL